MFPIISLVLFLTITILVMIIKSKIMVWKSNAHIRADKRLHNAAYMYDWKRVSEQVSTFPALCISHFLSSSQVLCLQRFVQRLGIFVSGLL